MGDVAVDAAALRQVGATVQSLGARLGGAVPPGAEATVEPAGNDGWAASAAMRQAGSAWLAEVRALASAVAAAGDDLTQAADAYDHTDEQAAAQVHGSARRAF